MEKEVIQDPVMEALQQAGEPTVVTPELIQLDQDRVTSQSNIPEEEFLFKISGVPCFPRCDLTTMTGPAKTGKTNVAAMLMACCAKGSEFEFQRISNTPLRVMWFDTEQSLCTTRHIITDRIGKMIGSEQFPDDQFYVFNVRRHTPKERVEMLTLAIETYRPDICFIDGIADLLEDINSGPASVELMQQLLTLATVNNCNITAMIHLNRSGEKLNLRGWIGTVMVQKSFEVFNCDKLEGSQTFSIDLTFSRRYYLKQTLYYTFDDDGLPVGIDQVAKAESAGGSTAQSAQKPDNGKFNRTYIDEHAVNPRLPWNFKKLFDKAMNSAAMLSYDDLADRAMKLSGIKLKTYYDRVFEAAEQQRVVKRVLDRSGRVVVVRLPC